MCGLSGFFHKGGFNEDYAANIADNMAHAIQHRGPDDSGVWMDASYGIALIHRRLSILDLSPAGHQPMMSRSGRYVIIFNGEIYNHLAMRREIESKSQPHEWRGYSDTETLLASIELWGLERTLIKTVGMFALALWDREQRVLCLARDRLGEKPLYYGSHNNVFFFASELKAMKAHPAFSAEVDRNALALQMRHNYVPGPYSIYKNIYKLQPGTWLRVDVSSGFTSIQQPVSYWSHLEVAQNGHDNLYSGSESDAIANLDVLLKDSIRQQMVADVPIGAFLSGGIDSSIIVALMQAQSDRPVMTFTIGFDEAGYNEANYAKSVAQHLGTAHTELYVTHKEALNVISRLPKLYDEPFSDSSQIATFLVSEMTRTHVKVSLSGDGGDELFGGYSRYLLARSIWNKVARLPNSVRSRLGSMIRLFSVEKWDVIMKIMQPIMPVGLLSGLSGDRAHKLAEILSAASSPEIYRGLVSHWKQPTEIVIDATEPMTPLADKSGWPRHVGFEYHMMYIDAITYLPDDILVKVDRAAMGISLETRVPMLDHRVVEFAWKLPLSMKIRNGQGKWILRQVLDKYVPKELIERPKMGFGVPIDRWLRGPLREWAESLLAEDRLNREGYFNSAPIRQKWSEHLSGRRNWQYHLWDVLMFQAWLEEQRA